MVHHPQKPQNGSPHILLSILHMYDLLRKMPVYTDMYVFVKEVCSMYNRLNLDPELHIRRADMVTSAVNAIFAEGIADELPFGGDVENAVKNVLPCVENVFQMPVM